MNLLLLAPADLQAQDRAVVAADRYPDRAGLWPPSPGRRLRVGLRDGMIGEAEVTAVADGRVALHFTLDTPPPPPLPLTLVLALPRPKMLRRVLRSAAELGIKRIHLVNSTRVEKSYWQSPLLAPAQIERYLVAGLEQCIDTMLPEVQLHPRLRPFAEDRLPALVEGCACLIAHPAATAPARAPGAAALALAIGPEGGFTDFELQLFAAAGFAPVSLGPRVLRVENALPVLVCALRPPAGPV